MPDPIFDQPRLAQIYDWLHGDRRDLDAYTTMADQFGALGFPRFLGGWSSGSGR